MDRRQKYGQALSFDGDDSVTIGDFDLAGPFTVMAWMQTRSLVTGGCASLVMKALDYGLAADRVFRTGFTSMWSRSFNSPFTGAATATGNSSRWLGNVIAFKRAGSSAPNTPPTISSAPGAQTIVEDTSTGALAITVGDAETAAGSLTLSGSTSNATLVPAGNIVLGGSGANRTVTVTPAPQENGTATVT